MVHLFRGEVIEGPIGEEVLLRLEKNLQQDLLLPTLSTEIVIQAVEKLMEQLDEESLIGYAVEVGIREWKARLLLQDMKELFSGYALRQKVARELSHPLCGDRVIGEDLYNYDEIEFGIDEKYQPYGVLMHVGAGNVIALSAMSIIEGMLAGNINLLKLPSYEGGISIQLLRKLVAIEPRLKPYIYVLDIPSSDTSSLTYIASLVDALVVWGSDEAIAGIRQLAPPQLPLIEWGHRMSFAYFTNHPHMDQDIDALAKEICRTDQQYCNSPQCVFYEGEDTEALRVFGEKLLVALQTYNQVYPLGDIGIREQAEITWTRELARMEELLGDKMLLEDANKDVAVMIDKQPALKASPLYRNIWLMPITREQIMPILRQHHGHLQTVGLSCTEDERAPLEHIFYRAGVTRITTTGTMSKIYAGEPHDGKRTLRQYMKRVMRRI